jgi:hypothetical protein
MKKVFLALTLMFIINSCDNSDANSQQAANSQQLFRSIYNNTSWADADGVIYTFKTGKIAYVSDTNGCYYDITGTYNNVEYDNCVYNTVTNTIVSEDNDTFSVRQITSTGVGSFCPASNTVFTFQILDVNTIEVKTNYDGSENSFLLTKTTNVSTQDCIEGTPNGYLW